MEPMSNAALKKRKGLQGKGGLIMMGVTVLLIIAFGAAQKAPPPREEGALPPVTEYAHVSADDVKRVEVKRPDGGFTLVRSGDEWSFQAPGSHRADKESVTNWLKGLLDDATVNRRVEGKPGDMAQYGLDKPAVEVALTSNGGDTRTLQIGKAFQAPGEMSTGPYYAREAKDGRLFMLAASQVDDVKNKKVLDLRDKHLMPVGETKDVQKIAIQRPAGQVGVERRGETKWQLLRPFQAPAGDTDVESLISDLRSARADAFEEPPGDAARLGFDKPRLTVTLTDRKGAHTVVFGAESKDKKVYARRQGEPQVMLVSKTTFDTLNKKPADLREKKLVTLDIDKISNVELTNAHGTVRLQKTSVLGSSAEWQFADGPNAKKKAKADTIQTLLTSVTAPAYKHVEEAPTDLAKYGLDKPQITVRVNEGSGTSQLFMLGKKTPTGNYYVKGTPNAVFEVQPYVYGDVNVTPDAFKDTSKK